MGCLISLRANAGRQRLLALYLKHGIVIKICRVLTRKSYSLLLIILQGIYPLFSTCCSHFGNIFDEDFFIHALRNHVNVVRELPEDILQRFDYNISNIVNLRVKGWSSTTYYLRKVLPKLEEMGYVSYLYYYF